MAKLAVSMCFHYGSLLNSNCCGFSALLWINETNITRVTESAWKSSITMSHLVHTFLVQLATLACSLQSHSQVHRCFARCRSPSSSLVFLYKRFSRVFAGFKKVQYHGCVAQVLFPSRNDNVLPPRFDSKALGNVRHMPKKSVDHIHLATIGGRSLRV